MNERVTVITGGKGGCGRSVVRKFLENGDKVIVLDLKDINDEKILQHPNFTFINMDVTDVLQIEKIKQIIEEKYGYIDNIISMACINMKS